MRHFRPLKPEETQALQAMDQNADRHREALQREIYELENSRVPVYRLALERLLFRQLVKACREMQFRPRALARVLDRIPHMSSSAEWAKMAPDERHDRMFEIPPQSD